MKTVILTKGLPASGKTTWARVEMAENPGKYKRVNKDDLRAMLDGGKWSKNNEKFVLKVRDCLILMALEEGKHVIVDDTNLHPKHEQQITQLVKGKARVEIMDFTEIPPETCIQRDLKRTESVGSKVIMDMYKNLLKPVQKKYVPPKGKPEAIICDLDGTLCLFGNKNPYKRDFINDVVNQPVLDILNTMASMHELKILLVSGRNNEFLEETEQWLEKHEIFFDELFMLRTKNDMRKDYEVKMETWEDHIAHNYQIQFVLDDRDQVVELWRSLGLTCLQVADGDF